MLSNLLGSDDKSKEIRTGTLKVRGKTLVLENSIYYIPNISVIEVGTIRRSVPLLAVLLIIAGAFILITPRLSDFVYAVAVFVISLNAYWIYSVLANPHHGLRFITNSGASALIISEQLSFLKQVALVLHNIMNDEMVKNINFNFDQRSIVEVGDVQSSAIVVGEVRGDLVSKL